MNWSVVIQPDGRFAIWSTIVDDFIACDCTEEEVVDLFVEDATKSAKRRTSAILGSMRIGHDPYHGRGMTYDACLKRRHTVHGGE